MSPEASEGLLMYTVLSRVVRTVPMAAKPLGACLLCKQVTCDCFIDLLKGCPICNERHTAGMCKGEPAKGKTTPFFMSEASKLKIRRWLEEEYDEDKDGTLEKVYNELCGIISEIVQEDSRQVLGVYMEKEAKLLEAESKRFKERAQKRLREEQQKHKK
jgi:hypothetical protein